MYIIAVHLSNLFKVYANYKDMKDLSNGVYPTVPTIKERLLRRFERAKGAVGLNWRKILAEKDPFFNTKIGVDYMRSVQQASSNSGRGHVDRIECVTRALEKIAKIKSPPIV